MVDFNAREAFGFGEKGFITLLVGNERVINEWSKPLEGKRASYSILFRWYVSSAIDISNLPSEIKSYKLLWDEVKSPTRENRLDDWYKIKAIVDKIYGEQKEEISSFQGTIGGIEQKMVIVSRIVASGKKKQYTFKDMNNNYYIWETATQNFNLNDQITLKMKIKDHCLIDGIPHTIVWYCKVKEN